MNYITPRRHTLGSGYISFRAVHLSGLPDFVDIDGETLPIQTEHHITLLCAIELAQALGDDQSDAIVRDIVQDFVDFESEHHLDEYQLGDNFYLVEEAERKSIVIDCNVPNLDKLFDTLYKKYDYKFDRQWPHITLYARGNEGIGLSSPERFAELARSIQLDLTLGKQKTSGQ